MAIFSNFTCDAAVRYLRLPHRWRLVIAPRPSDDMLRDFIQPAIRAIPRSIVRRLPLCTFLLAPSLDGEDIASRWTETAESLEIAVSTEAAEPHDIALELLTCLGQALWERTTIAERTGWLALLRAEIEDGVNGEIDDGALLAKREILSSHAAALSTRRLEEYARASFAGTAAEYIHCLWHDVTVRTGPEHLPAGPLRKRIEFMTRFFAPNRGPRVIA